MSKVVAASTFWVRKALAVAVNVDDPELKVVH